MKFKLPVLDTKLSPTTTSSHDAASSPQSSPLLNTLPSGVHAGPVVHGAHAPGADALPPLQVREVTAESRAESGLTAYEPPAQVPTQTSMIADQAQPSEADAILDPLLKILSTPLPPAASHVTVAKAEELARESLETRRLVVETIQKVASALTELQRLNAEQDALRGEVRRHPDALSNVHARLTLLDEGHGAQIGQLMGDVKALHKSDAEIVEMIRIDNNSARSRFDAIDATLSQRGLPVSTAGVAPTITLHQKRRVNVPARVDGDAVVLSYNPRQGTDGADDIEFRLRDVPRNVWCGYAIHVPAGRICDVVVGQDVVMSLYGGPDAGKGELVIPLRSRGEQRTISAGAEIARLMLRKTEAVRLEIVRE